MPNTDMPIYQPGNKTICCVSPTIIKKQPIGEGSVCVCVCSQSRVFAIYIYLTYSQLCTIIFETHCKAWRCNSGLSCSISAIASSFAPSLFAIALPLG